MINNASFKIPTTALNPIQDGVFGAAPDGAAP